MKMENAFLTDGPIAWVDWYAFVINELRAAISDAPEMHPCGHRACHEDLGHLIDAAERNDHAECLRLEALIRERIEWEVSLWFRQIETPLDFGNPEHAAQKNEVSRNEAAR